jgi:hypothetical protein
MYKNIVRMTRKLTLSLDPDVIRRAKRVAKQRGTSVSRMVQIYLDLVSRSPKVAEDPPVLRRLRGLLKGGSVGDYRRYLREKYR